MGSRIFELALVTGRGRPLLTTYDGRWPLVRDEDVVAFGFRDEWEAQSYGSPPLAEKIKAIGLEAVRRMGLGSLTRGACICLGTSTRDFGFTSMPMCSTTPSCQRWTIRLPGGLSWLEIEHVLSAALAHPRAVGMEVTILNPRLDTDGKVLSAFVDMLTAFAKK